MCQKIFIGNTQICDDGSMGNSLEELSNLSRFLFSCVSDAASFEKTLQDPLATRAWRPFYNLTSSDQI